jgi:hypothetical protein
VQGKPAFELKSSDSFSTVKGGAFASEPAGEHTAASQGDVLRIAPFEIHIIEVAADARAVR